MFRFSFSALILCALLASSLARAAVGGSTGIQMLPPLQDTATGPICAASTSNKILTWDGQNPIQCKTNVAVTSSGHLVTTQSLGVRTSTPLAQLNVVGSSLLSRDNVGECCSSGDYTLGLAEKTSVTGKMASIQFHNSGVHEAYLRLASSGQRRLQIGDNQSVTAGLQMSGPLYVDSTGSSYFSGNVGIGTSAPTAKLDVRGAVRVGTDGAACTAAKAGAVRYDSATKTMQYCNETQWAPMAATSFSPQKVVRTCAAYNFDGTYSSNGAGWCRATCPAGKIIVSGGCFSAGPHTVFGSYMEGATNNQWRCIGTVGDAMTVTILCLEGTPAS